MSKALNTLDNIGTIAVIGSVGALLYFGIKNAENIKNWFSSLNPFAKKDETTLYSQTSDGTSIIGTTNQSNEGKTLQDYEPYITDGTKILRLIAVVNGNPVYSDTPAQTIEQAEITGIKETIIPQSVQEIQEKLNANEGYTGTSQAVNNTRTNTSLRTTSAGINTSSVSVFQPSRDESNMTSWDKRIASNLRNQGQSESQIKSYLGY